MNSFDGESQSLDTVWRKSSIGWKILAVAGLLFLQISLVGIALFLSSPWGVPGCEGPVRLPGSWPLESFYFVAIASVPISMIWLVMIRSGRTAWLWGLLWFMPNGWILCFCYGFNDPFSFLGNVRWWYLLILASQLWVAWNAGRARAQL
jgi:hypothetical protein